MTIWTELSPSALSVKRALGDEVFEELARRAGGRCHLCDDALDLSTDAVEKDQIEPGKGYYAANVYLAHQSCNALRRDLPVEAARRMIRFRKFCEARSHDVSFDDVLDTYVSDPKRKQVTVELEGVFATIRFDRRREVQANVMSDPATDVRFFFCDVPVQFLHNDKAVQPRRIDWSHAWAMAQDFEVHPVHEPSSCRIDVDLNGRGKLLQFDGQHKTAAQIILGRESVEMKIYLNPPLAMIRDLIISIQNKIVKLPLQAAVAMSKLADVYREHWIQTGAETEEGFVKSYRSDQQAAAKRELFAAIYKGILDDPNSRIDAFVQKQRARRGMYPLSMNNLINLLLKQLVCQEAQNVEVGSSADLRPEEAKNVLAILNQLAEQLLLNQKWQFDRPRGVEPSGEHLKAKRFFTPGAVKGWAPLLRAAINYRLHLDLLGDEEKAKPLLRRVAADQEKLIADVVARLVEHPIWSDDKADIDGPLGENKAARTNRLFKEYAVPLHPAYVVGLPI